jgi:hypothetical protein
LIEFPYGDKLMEMLSQEAEKIGEQTRLRKTRTVIKTYAGRPVEVPLTLSEEELFLEQEKAVASFWKQHQFTSVIKDREVADARFQVACLQKKITLLEEIEKKERCIRGGLETDGRGLIVTRRGNSRL